MVLRRALPLMVGALLGCFGDRAQNTPDAEVEAPDAPAPVDVASDRPASTPTDVTTDVGADVTAVVTGDVATDVTADVAADAAKDASTDASIDAPTDVRTDALVDVPTDVRTDAPIDAPIDVRTDALVDVPADAPTDAPADVPADASAESIALEWPFSGATVTSTRPTVEFTGASDGALVEFCRDRACTRLEQSVTASVATFTRPTTALSAGVHFWRVRPRTGGRSSAVWQFTVPRRDAALADTAGGAIADFNGDGWPDLAVGEPQGVHADTRAADGYVHVFVNRGERMPGLEPSRVLNLPRLAGGGFGSSTTACDLDRDGFVDLAVGGGESVMVFRGGASGLVATPVATLPGYTRALCVGDGLVVSNASASVLVRGPAFNAAAGIPLGAGTPVSVGDLDGDRTIDLAVLRAGAVLVTLRLRGGSDRAITLRAPTGVTLVGATTAGDLDGDGYADLVAGGVSTAGSTLPDRVMVFPGGPAGPATAPTQVLTAPVLREQGFGTALGSAGDANGDGYDDVVVGTAQNSNSTSNYVHVYAGGSRGLATTPTTRTFGGLGRYGSTVGRAGDVDGDGLGDVLVGSRGNSDSISGTVRLYAGSAATLIGDPPTATLRGMSTNGNFSAAFAGWQ